jgi:hypothetical protein
MQTQTIFPLATSKALLLGRPLPAMPSLPAASTQSVSPLIEIAAERGFPATLFGFTPADAGYWREPGVPWTGALPQTAAELEAYRLQPDGMLVQYELAQDDHRMAPRFPGGSLLRVIPVTCKRAIVQGVYLWKWTEEGVEYANMGRLHQIRRGRLRLTHDVDGREVGCRLRWSNPTFKLYRVIGYDSIPCI